MKDSKNPLKQFGLAFMALCAVCCSFPIIGVILGISTLSVIAKYIEWAGIAALVLAIISFAVYRHKRKSAPACDINCECRDEKKAIENSK